MRARSTSTAKTGSPLLTSHSQPVLLALPEFSANGWECDLATKVVVNFRDYATCPRAHRPRLLLADNERKLWAVDCSYEKIEMWAEIAGYGRLARPDLTMTIASVFAAKIFARACPELEKPMSLTLRPSLADVGPKREVLSLLLTFNERTYIPGSHSSRRAWRAPGQARWSLAPLAASGVVQHRPFSNFAKSLSFFPFGCAG